MSNRFPEAHTLPAEVRNRISIQLMRDIDVNPKAVEQAVVFLAAFCEDTIEVLLHGHTSRIKTLSSLVKQGTGLVGSFLEEARGIVKNYVEGPLFEYAAWKEGLVSLEEIQS
jgi:hypothetical protein